MITRYVGALRRFALVALLLAPALSAAQPRRERADGPYGYGAGGAMGPALGQLGFGLLLALDIPPSGLDVGPRFTGELMYGLAQLSPQLRADLGGRLSFAYHGFSRDTEFFVGSGHTWILEVVPDLRLIFAASDRLAIYGDFGVGLAVIRDSFDGDGSNSGTEATFQIGPGLSYAIAPNLNFLAELRFDFYTRSGDGTFIALPTVGFQWH